MIDASYLAAPALGYLLGGMTKFAVNSLRAGVPAFGHIGLGGFPSTHTSIVTAAIGSVVLETGWDDPIVAVAAALWLVVVIDAMDLRRKIERLNRGVKAQFPDDPELQSLRDRLGHTPVEVAGGVIVGIAAAWVAQFL